MIPAILGALTFVILLPLFLLFCPRWGNGGLPSKLETKFWKEHPHDV